MLTVKEHSKEKQQIVNELHKPIRKNFKRRRTLIKGLDESWQCDLAQMTLYASSNKNFKYILIVIDCFSKYLWGIPIKSKSGPEVTKAFELVLKTGRCPKNLQTDQGKEFFNTNFQNLMKKYKINHYHTYSCTKAAIAERVIRTIKERLFKFFSLNGSYNWISILPEIIANYNNTKHSTTGMKPIDINKKNESRVLRSAYNFIKMSTEPKKFSIGDVVRISKVKHVFQKGYTPNWTTELFKIVKVKITTPPTYLLEDMEGRPIRGTFYEAELQKTLEPNIYLVEKVLRRRGNKVFVSWLGLDKKHNSWIDKTNVF